VPARRCLKYPREMHDLFADSSSFSKVGSFRKRDHLALSGILGKCDMDFMYDIAVLGVRYSTSSHRKAGHVLNI
jgi:hypothetical protein